MAEMRTIYNEITAELISKGFSGMVSQVDHDYKNRCACQQANTSSHEETSYIKTKTKNEIPADLFPLDGGDSLPIGGAN